MADEPEETAAEQRLADIDEAQEQADQERIERDAGGRFGRGNSFRFQPGVSGNPNGRPRGISDLIDRVIEEEIDTKGELGRRETLELMVRAMVRTALKGGSSGTSAFRELMDRRFGRVPLSVRLSPEDDDGPAQFRIRLVNREDVEAEAARAPAKAFLSDGTGNGNGNG